MAATREAASDRGSELGAPWHRLPPVDENGRAERIPRGHGRRVVAVAAAVLLMIVVFNAIIDANSVAVLVWGTDPPPFPPTL